MAIPKESEHLPQGKYGPVFPKTPACYGFTIIAKIIPEKEMEELIARGWAGLVERVGGPMTFRLILQPAMAALLAVRAGLKDAREGRPPYFWTLVTDSSQRVDLLREGWKSIARVFLLAVIMDLIYEWVMGRSFYPLETLIVAIGLAVVPYLLLRGPVNRIARRWRRGRAARLEV